jgi:hypothetical protein
MMMKLLRKQKEVPVPEVPVPTDTVLPLPPGRTFRTEPCTRCYVGRSHPSVASNSCREGSEPGLEPSRISCLLATPIITVFRQSATVSIQ